MPSCCYLPFTHCAVVRLLLYGWKISTGNVRSLSLRVPSSGGRTNNRWSKAAARRLSGIFNRYDHTAPPQRTFLTLKHPFAHLLQGPYTHLSATPFSHSAYTCPPPGHS